MSLLTAENLRVEIIKIKSSERKSVEIPSRNGVSSCYIFQKISAEILERSTLDFPEKSVNYF